MQKMRQDILRKVQTDRPFSLQARRGQNTPLQFIAKSTSIKVLSHNAHEFDALLPIAFQMFISKVSPNYHDLTNHELIQHKRDVHYMNRMFKCEKYVREFTSQENLTRHSANTHGERSKITFTCDMCQKSLSSKHALQRHMNSVRT